MKRALIMLLIILVIIVVALIVDYNAHASDNLYHGSITVHYEEID